MYEASYRKGSQDLALDMKLAIYFLELLTDRFLEMSQHLIEAADGNIDVVAWGDDVAIATRPMMSRRMFDQIVLSYEKRVFKALRSWTDAKILFHIDGPIVWHLDDLIEIGVDSLNSVDVGAKDMEDTASLKARFGERISFWDRIETSRELLFGTLEDVHTEVRRRVGDLHHNGGYDLASVYNILAEVPPENICPIWETVDLLE